MASQMATPSYTPEVHEDVDFMFMFMAQQQQHDEAAVQEQQYMQPVPASFDPNMYSTPASLITTPAPFTLESTIPKVEPSSTSVPTSAATPNFPNSVVHSSPHAIESTSAHASPSGSSDPASEAPRQAGRRKRKLTPEDKRRICQIYRTSQGKIRQEDIAKQYSVDRSTISKILNQEERWLDSDAPGAGLLARRPGGRYPAIEEEMHRWLDEAVMQGREVRDSEAREEALRIGLRLGHPHFQASSKWWDGVKRRRIEEGRPLPTARRHAITPPMGIVRSYSAMGMDPYPREAFPMGVAGPSQHPYAFFPAHMQVPMPMRSRSQSSPQVIPAAFQPGAYAAQAASFGPAPRQRFSPGHANAVALRQWTFPAGSPGRPQSRPGSSQGNHQQMTSVFGYTGGDLAPPAEITTRESMHVPALSHSSGMSPGSIAISEPSSDPSGATLSPETPRTPAQTNFTNLPMALSNECVDFSTYPQFQQPLYTQATACMPEAQYMQQPLYAGYVQPQW